MDIVKKNILSILCGVVALAGVVIWFFPISGMYDALADDVKKQAALYAQVEGVRTQQRNLPTVELGGETERKPLGRFPNEEVIKEGERATEAMKGQSERMIGEVTKLNIHQPLEPNALPESDGNAHFNFIDLYLQRLGVELPAALKATTPPTADDLMAKAQEVYDAKYVDQIVPSGTGGKDNKDVVDRQFAHEMKDLPETERRRAARDGKIYLSAEGLPASPDIIPGQVPRPEEIWYAQTVLWIQEDLVKSIANANADALNVMDAPIKHLMAMTIAFGPEMYVRAGGATAAAAGAEGATATIATDENGAPAVWSASPTGRVSNDLYDVIHFDLALRVDARKVPQVIAALERSQLLTVLKTSVAAIDAAAEKRQWGYVYGNEPVVTLLLQCEVLFLRKWTLDTDNEGKNALMPIDVQRAIGAAPPAPEATPAE